jgi:uncharacterized protein (DUF1330 family)
MPKAYVIYDVTVTNPEQMAKYREWSTRAIEEHQAQVLVRGGAIEVLEGNWKPTRIVVMGFESMDKARAYYHGETYTHARQLREGAGVLNGILVEGV